MAETYISLTATSPSTKTLSAILTATVQTSTEVQQIENNL